MRTGQRMVLTHNRKKLNNKGFSLIELIVVIAIIVVLTTAAVLSVGVIRKANEKRLVREIAQAMGETKIMTMASGQAVYMSIERDANGVYINKWPHPKATGPVKELIKGSKNLTVKVNGAAYSSGEKKIEFNKVTGAVLDSSNDLLKVECGTHKLEVYKSTGKVDWE